MIDDMWDTSARLLRLLSLLQTPRDWSGPELADRLGVSTRTIRADVDRLRGLGYPVDATRGAAGGYRLGAGASLPPLLLDDDEAVAMVVGLRSAAGNSVEGIEESSLRALAKLEQVLPSRLRRRVGALQSHVVAVQQKSDGSNVAPTLLTAVAAACRDHERVRFAYADRDGRSSHREAEPYRLVTWGRRWYLVAWDVGRTDWRTFRCDRMTMKTPNGPRFTPRPLPAEDLAAYVAGGISVAAQPYRARVQVHAPAAAVLERINPSVGTVEALDPDSCILHTGADSIETMAVWIGMLGMDFTVLEPPELSAQLEVLSDRYARAVRRPAAGSRGGGPGRVRRRPPA